MTRRLLLAFLLVASTASATDICKVFNFPGASGAGGHNLFVCDATPEGAQPGLARGDKAVVKDTEAEYRFAGTPGSTAGWVPTVTGLTFCGNRVREGTEQCDVVNGTGAAGECATADDCIEPSESVDGTPCTCRSTAPTCGNGQLDGAEACDPAATDGDVIALMSCPPARCTGGCRCLCGPQASGGPVGGTCRVAPFTLDRDCVGLDGSALGDSETCEEATGGGGGTFGNAVDFEGSTGATGVGGVISTNLANGSALEVVLEMAANDAVIQFYIRADDPTYTQKIIYKGGISTTQGWVVSLLSGGTLRLDNSDGTNGSCMSTAGAIAAGVWTHVVITKTATTCNFWFMNRTTGATVHTVSNGAGGIRASSGAGSTVMSIGGRTDLTDRFDGFIDELNIKIGAAGLVAAFEGGDLNNDWKFPACSSNITGTSACWQFDEAGVTSIREGTTGTDSVDLQAGWLRAASPFPAAPDGGGGTSTPCAAGETCNANCQCQPDDPGPGGGGQIVYWSPTGNDANTGAAEAAPVKTWARAKGLVSGPGTTVMMLDGTYTRATTGFPQMNCGAAALCTGPDPCGTAALPITISAKNERQAFLDNTGAATSGGSIVSVSWCRGIKVQGLRIRNGNLDGPQSMNIHVNDSDFTTIRRNLAYDNDINENNHPIEVSASTNTVIEENEVYNYTRHGISVFQCVGGRIARNYVNSRSRADSNPDDPIGCCSARTCTTCAAGACGGACCAGACDSNYDSSGDEGISIYGSNGFVVENNVLENAGGIQCHGNATFKQNGAPYAADEYGCSENVIVGNIIRGGIPVGLLIQPRTGQPHAARNNVVQNDLFISPDGNGVYMRGATNATIQNVSVVGATGAGFSADETSGTGAYPSCATLASEGNACSFAMRNNLAVNNTGVGFALADLATDYVCSADRIATNDTIAAFFTTTCAPTNPDTALTLTGFGLNANESTLWVPNTATDINDEGGTAATGTLICKGTTTSEYKPCGVAGDCTGGAPTCVSPIGATVLMRYSNGARTWNPSCTAAGAPWPCCTGAGTGRCELWAKDTADCGGAACTTQATNCQGTHTNGTPPMPDCLSHFVGCGAIVAGVNDTDGDSCFDFHERNGIRIGQRGTDATLPTLP